ncbi:hypothetical protein [Streptomyces rimosus]|uniref:hypothetical protein n=1 Tax=Streptomyces rimosus TaxID=1927 RepID=UPI001F1A9F24|nr:hypothetical protein [Streptomyces rimosus]
MHATDLPCPQSKGRQKSADSCPTPSAGKPAAKKPAAKKPTANKQAPQKPRRKKQAAKKPRPKKQAVRKPSGGRPAGCPPCQSAPGKTAAKKPAAKKQMPRKPRPKKEAAKKPRPKKQAAMKPGGGRPAACSPCRPGTKKPSSQKPSAQPPSTTKPPAKKKQLKADHGWSWQGLTIDAADLRKVNVFLARAKKAERTISPQVRSLARKTKATMVGFNERKRSPESVKRSVARDMQNNPSETVDDALDKVYNSVRYILQWPDASYVKGVKDSTKMLAKWKNANLRWSNTWARARGYKGINTAWRANNSGHPYELQFHTPKSQAAQKRSSKLYEEAHHPRTTGSRRAQLQNQMNRNYASVPCPAGAQLLSAPRRRAMVRPGVTTL